MTCSWIIHILWKMLLHALLGTVVPRASLQEEALLMHPGKKNAKTKEIKVFFGVTSSVT